MNTNRLWVLGTLLIIIALIAGTLLLGVQPQLSAAGAANAQRTTVEAQNRVEENTLATLKEQFKGYGDLVKQIEGLRKEIPTSAELVPLIKEIAQMGTDSGVFITGLNFASPVTFAPPESLDPSYPDPLVSSAYGSLSSGDFIVIPVTLAAQNGAYEPVMDFVNRLQHSGRFFLVYEMGVVLEEDEGVPTWKMNLAGHIYVLLDSLAAPPAADPGTDAPATDAPATDEGTVTQ